MVMKGDSRSLDYSSYGRIQKIRHPFKGMWGHVGECQATEGPCCAPKSSTKTAIVAFASRIP